MNRARLTGVRRAEALALYRRGLSLKAVARQMGETYHMIRATIDHAGAVRGHGTAISITADDRREAVRLYSRGVRMEDISAQTGIRSRDTILRYVDAAGVPRRDRSSVQPITRIPASVKRQVLGAYASGTPRTAICNTYDISETTLNRLVRAAGLPRRQTRPTTTPQESS